MSVGEYAQANGLDPDTALTHMVLFAAVEATGLDEDWQRRTFKMLLNAVNAHEFAASVREMAKELVTPPATQTPKPPLTSSSEYKAQQ
jgi:hypothetical protein